MSRKRCVQEGASKRCTREIGTGDAAVDKTVAVMRELARRDAKSSDVRELAATFSGDDIEELREIFSYVVERIPYEADPPDREYVKAPVKTLFDIEPYGDCDDLATALASLILAAKTKRRVWFRTIAWRKQAFTHVFVMAEIPSLGIVIPLDPVMGARGFGHAKEPTIRHKDYPV